MVIGQHKINPVTFVRLLSFGLFLSYWSFVFCGGFSVLFVFALWIIFSLKKRAKDHEVGWGGSGDWENNQSILYENF